MNDEFDPKDSAGDDEAAVGTDDLLSDTVSLEDAIEEEGVEEDDYAGETYE